MAFRTALIAGIEVPIARRAEQVVGEILSRFWFEIGALDS